jgi:tetratricopeptide (TPR) repeat protein
MLMILLFGLVFVGCGVFIAHRVAQRGAGDIVSGVTRWIATIAAICLLAMASRSLSGGFGAFILLAVVMFVGVLLSYLWLPRMIEFFLGGLTGAMTGGNEEVEAKPYYFRANAQRRQGNFNHALVEIDTELERFPGNTEGLLLKAEIQADDLKDVDGAMGTLRELEMGGDPAGRLLAQLQRAELLVTRKQAIEQARDLLELIVRGNPGSEAARTATQRLAHLPSEDGGAEVPRRLTVVHHEERLGLTQDLGAAQEPEPANNRAAQDLLDHLAMHPSDWEAREKLALLYVEHYGHIALAVDQYQALLAQPDQPARRVATWLQQLADLHLKHSHNPEAARPVLEEIVRRFPDTAWSQQAQRRLATLGLAEKAGGATTPLKLGVYEQNIGLKGRPIPEQEPNEPS